MGQVAVLVVGVVRRPRVGVDCGGLPSGRVVWREGRQRRHRAVAATLGYVPWCRAAGHGQGVDLGEDRGGRVAVGAHETPHALDEVEDVLPLLAHERLAEQDAELADVAAQGGLGRLAGG